jgi:hypothetical protein
MGLCLCPPRICRALRPLDNPRASSQAFALNFPPNQRARDAEDTLFTLFGANKRLVKIRS